MTTINLKRYYPYMTENVMLEVSDEIAAALSMGGRLCDSYKRQKRRNGECSLEQSSHKTVFAKAPEMGKIWRDFGHAFSFASSSSRGMYPSPSYLIWMCCTRFPLDLSGAST